MRKGKKLFAALTLVAFCAPMVAQAEGNAVSADIQLGAKGVAISDDIKRVNEYTSIKDKPGVNPFGDVKLNVEAGGVAVEGQAFYVNSYDQKYDAKIDIMRGFKIDGNYNVFQHHLSHDKLDYLDAAIPAAPGTATSGIPAPGYTGTAVDADSGAGTVNIFPYAQNPIGPNFVPTYFVYSAADPTDSNLWYVTNGAPNATTNAYIFQQLGRASMGAEDFVPNQDFSIIRKEMKSNADLTIPGIPNITLHAGFRNETREGYEQSIGMSKCTSCHITGSAKQINERTDDYTAGATGKFGLLTVDYSYLNRQFREMAETPTRLYDPALSPSSTAAYATAGPFDNRLLYDYELSNPNGLKYDMTPDSDKKSHTAKAKLDLPRNSSFFASYVKSTVESKKEDDGTIMTLADKNLESKYEAWSGKASTKFGKNLTLSARVRVENIEDDKETMSYTVLRTTYAPATPANPGLGTVVDPESLVRTRESVTSRDTLTGGLDAVYRLAKRSTLRLGYEYQNIDREDELFGETTIHKAKAALNTRTGNGLATRVTYVYKKVDDPFQNPTAAMVEGSSFNGVYNDLGNPYTVGTGLTYGVQYYDLRKADLSNQFEDQHDAAISTTWSASPRYSTTLSYRVKLEENDLNRADWKQQTQTPSISFWYAPTEKVSMTLGYNLMYQKTTTPTCQGLYDG